MSDWPHAPAHRLVSGATYIVTSATYGKAPIFNSMRRLNLLRNRLFALCSENDWHLQAWAMFPNHYHFVAQSETAGSLSKLVRELHSLTSHAVNALDGCAGRRVWFQYWETQLTNQRSYFARLRYVHENAVHHGIVRRAANYPWCSASWFERTALPSFRKTVLSFPCDRVSVRDSFEVHVKLPS